MLHSLDMPSSLDDDTAAAASTSPHHHHHQYRSSTAASIASKRSSVEKQSRRSADSIPTPFKEKDEPAPVSAPPLSASSSSRPNGTNGINGSAANGANGINGTLFSNGTGYPARASSNGQLVDGESLQKETEGRTVNSATALPLANVSRPSTIVESESLQGESHKPHRLAGRDDGYFAEHAVTEERFFSTHVKLAAASNGDLVPLPSDAETSKDSSGPDAASTAAPGASSENSGAESLDAATKRISSPAALQPSSTTNLATPLPGRLQHRHTLEVPGVSSRISRETTRTIDDVAAYSSGRFSPTSNTPTRRRGSISLVRRITRSGGGGGHSDLYLNELPHAEDAERWAEAIRQKRASKRKRREEEDDDRVVMGTKVDQNHVNYVTAYNMLTGIRFTVSRTNAKLDRELTDADFDARHKFSFDM
jgi:1-phosphatidylinositol-4-phosphate 5-kinase